MKLHNFLLITASLAVTSHLSNYASAADLTKTVDKAKAAITPGEFVLSGTQVKKIHSSKTAMTYNICVKAEKDSAMMKVTHDGQSETIAPGECKDVTGMKIEATAAEKLTGSSHIVATYHKNK